MHRIVFFEVGHAFTLTIFWPMPGSILMVGEIGRKRETASPDVLVQ